MLHIVFRSLTIEIEEFFPSYLRIDHIFRMHEART